MEAVLREDFRRNTVAEGLMRGRPDTAFRRLLWMVFTGTRGGINRMRIIATLREQPMNAHRLALQLGMDYKTITHHLSVLQRNHLIVKTGEGYGAMYFPSPELEEHYEDFLSIRGRVKVN